MDLFILYVVIPFVVASFIRALLGNTDTPRTLYTIAELPSSGNKNPGAGCLPTLLFGAIVVFLLWIV